MQRQGHGMQPGWKVAECMPGSWVEDPSCCTHARALVSLPGKLWRLTVMIVSGSTCRCAQGRAGETETTVAMTFPACFAEAWCVLTSIRPSSSGHRHVSVLFSPVGRYLVGEAPVATTSSERFHAFGGNHERTREERGRCTGTGGKAGQVEVWKKRRRPVRPVPSSFHPPATNLGSPPCIFFAFPRPSIDSHSTVCVSKHSDWRRAPSRWRGRASKQPDCLERKQYGGPTD